VLHTWIHRDYHEPITDLEPQLDAAEQHREVWQWCIDLNEVSDGCFPEVVCEDSRTVVPAAYDWPAGCGFEETDLEFVLMCHLDANCEPA